MSEYSADVRANVTAQAAWLNAQAWFPFAVTDPVRFHFETRQQ